MNITEKQLKSLIKQIVKEAIEPVIQKRPDQNHEFDDGRYSVMKAVNVGESFGDNKKIYKVREGGKYVYKMDNKDTGGKTILNPDNIQKYIRQGYRIITVENVEESHNLIGIPTLKGDIVKIRDGSGVDSGKVGRIVKTKFKQTSGGMIPDEPGAYKPQQKGWISVEFEDGHVASFPRNRLERSSLQSNIGESIEDIDWAHRANSIETYKQMGFKCGEASKRRDQGLVTHTQSWFNTAIKSEQGEYAVKARETFLQGYREGSGAGGRPQYFREKVGPDGRYHDDMESGMKSNKVMGMSEISLGSLFKGKKKEPTFDMSHVHALMDKALEHSKGDKIKAVSMLNAALNSAQPELKDIYVTAIHYLRKNNDFKSQNQGRKETNFVGENNDEKIKGKFVDRGSVKLNGGLDYNTAEKIANYHWDIFGSFGKDEKGVFNFKTRGDAWCCSVGMLNGKPAMLNRTTTPGRLQLLVGDELDMNLKEESGTGAVGGYSTPFAFSRNKLGSGKAIAAAKKYGTVVKSISEKGQK